MKPRRPNPSFAPAPLTDADIARVLSSEHDGILPSSGFARSVMAAIAHDATAPAPIPFPWKRALPGFAAIAVALALLIAVLVSLAVSASAAPAAAATSSAGALDTAALLPFLHSTQDTSIVLWTAVTIAAFVVSLVFFRRLLATR
ncbi:MAG: hypothetical protein WB622_05240 [Acidobacteriaceae bacterium]|jgi:hypothetical protein